ncbi:hypothetical protein CLOP_g19869 [Closterium sp. NIES-67]|nr:hypothetical protein CLOP_g19869 [Closterium sp. NIES-67]
MDLEARSLPPADRAHLLARLRAHKLALLAAKKRAKEMAGDAGEGGAVAGQRGGGGGLRAAEERAALMEEGRDYVPLSEGKGCMVHWWTWHGTDCPELAKLACRVLTQPVSASACERNWAVWDSVHTAWRNKLGSEKLKDLVYIAHN